MKRETQMDMILYLVVSQCTYFVFYHVTLHRGECRNIAEALPSEVNLSERAECRSCHVRHCVEKARPGQSELKVPFIRT